MQSKRHITFVKSNDDLDNVYKKKQIYTFYQICQFKSKFSKKYETRKIIYNELNHILKIYQKEYSYDVLNSFLKHHRQNKYKIYPVNTIDQIEMPSEADIMCSQSELLNSNSKNYDYKHL
jgi:hypothetical protein